MDSLSNMGKLCKLYKNNRYKFVYERQSTNETCYRCTMGKCSAPTYIDAHGIIREGTAQHIHADSVKDMNYEILRFYNYFYLSRMAYKHLPIDDCIVVFLSMYKLKQMCFIEVCLLNLVSWLKITS